MEKTTKVLFWEFILLCIIASTECLAFEEINLPVASDAILFENNFDGKSPLPEMSAGKEAPILIIGKADFVKGINGYSLFCGKGGAKIRYSSKSNIDFDTPGTVSFWFFTDNWQKGVGEPRTLFFATECSKGYIGAETENDPKSISPLERKILLRILYSPVIPDCSLALPPIGVKGDNMWHLLIFAWSGNKIYMSLDGSPFSSKDLKDKVSAKALPSEHFSIGSESSQNYFLDEFRIYAGKLSDMQVKAIWERGNMEINKNKQKAEKQ